MKFNIPYECRNELGVYIIHSTVTNECYIGATKNFRKRHLAHLSSLNNLKCNDSWKEYLSKHSIETLIFSCLEYANHKRELLPMEAKHIKAINPTLNIVRTSVDTVLLNMERRNNVPKISNRIILREPPKFMVDAARESLRQKAQTK